MDNDEWLTTLLQNGGQPLALRIRPLGAVENARERYGTLLVVTHTLDLVNSNGLPDPDYNDSLFAFECSLLDQLELEGRVVVVETTGGNRVYYAYVADLSASKLRASGVISKFGVSAGEFRGGPDPAWQFYFRYIETVPAAISSNSVACKTKVLVAFDSKHPEKMSTELLVHDMTFPRPEFLNLSLKLTCLLGLVVYPVQNVSIMDLNNTVDDANKCIGKLSACGVHAYFNSVQDYSVGSLLYMKALPSGWRLVMASRAPSLLVRIADVCHCNSVHMKS